MIFKGLDHDRLSSANEAPSELRLGLIALAILAVFGLFILRLFQLQILEGADLADRSLRNSVRTVRLEAPRGDIVDREGRVLATSRPAFRVQVIANDLRDGDATLSVLGELLGRDSTEIEKQVGRPTGRRRFQPVVVEGDLGYEARARIEAHRYALPGVVTDMVPRRDYVERQSAAHLLGTIGQIDAQQLGQAAFSGYRAGDVIGKYGLEFGLESHLRGRTGGRNLVVDVAGQEIDVIEEVAPVPGGRLVLTLDLDLQRAAEEAFRAKGPGEADRMGALVAIDPRNGDVLAMVSRPAYDPNLFAGGIDASAWASLTGDAWHPLRNRAISGQYPPGSTYKPFVALAALSEGKIDAETTVFCPGYYRLGRRVYRCWKRSGHGEVNLAAALRDSCDVFFYRVGVELGVDAIASFARRFGLGARTGVSLQGEAAGLVPTRAWKERVRGESWIKGETVSAAIGQGYDLVTPIQLANAYAALAHGGERFPPRLVQRLESWDGEVVADNPTGESEQAGVDPAFLDQVREGLIAVVEGTPAMPGTEQSPPTRPVQGTGARARVTGLSVAGKTGTSQVVRLDVVESMGDQEIPIRYRDHALFAAYAPVEAPEIAVAVVVEHAGQGGGTVAAPIAREVIAKWFEKKRARELEAEREDVGQQAADRSVSELEGR